MFINSNNINNDTNIDSSFNNNKEKDNKFNIKTILIIAVILIILVLGIIFIPKLFKNNGESTFSLNGGDIKIYKNSKYIDLGFIAKDKNDNDISDKVKIEGTVNTSEIGEYIITYKLGKKELNRKVNVIDKGNVTTLMTLNGDQNIEINLNEEYIDKDVTIIDSTSKNLEDQVIKYENINTSKVGTYKIIYAFVNSEGVTISTERIITVK